MHKAPLSLPTLSPPRPALVYTMSANKRSCLGTALPTKGRLGHCGMEHTHKCTHMYTRAHSHRPVHTSTPTCTQTHSHGWEHTELTHTHTPWLCLGHHFAVFAPGQCPSFSGAKLWRKPGMGLWGLGHFFVVILAKPPTLDLTFARPRT